ncbi:MAG: FG-GAP repeat protein [Proteobacteria bacterium]|nr:FG-GAP repeat protein [Pseudomonadota bacterium]
MKIRGRAFLAVLGAAAVVAAAVAGCGGGGGTPSDTVSLNTIGGSKDVPVDSSFSYTFNQMVSTATVTGTSFFITPVPAAAAQTAKDAYDDTVCNPAGAVAASISCPNMTECVLDPAADLAAGTQYAACLSQAINYATGTAFEGFTAIFTTAGGVAPGATGKLVKLDGTEIEFTAAPIPRSVKVKYIPDTPITDAAAQQDFEAAIELKDGAGTAVAGAYAWAADGTSVLFTPDARLGYRTTHTVYASGTAVAGASFTTLTRNDIDGDGYADLLVGALYAGSLTRDGKLYIFYGTATGIPTCDLSAACAPGASFAGAQHDYLAVSNKMVGDVNGDGYEDFIVGAPQTSGTRKGKAYLFAGGTGLTGTLDASDALATISMGAAGNDDLGYSVAGAGDMNGDWYDDVIVAAPLTGGDGSVHIFAGGASLAGALDVANATQSIAGQSGDVLGMMLDGAGDVNGDGLDDIVVGSDKNRAYVFYGAAALAATRNAAAADAIITGTVKFGNTVAGAGDVDGDGIADVMVGEPVVNAGKVYVFPGNVLAGTTLTPASASTVISETSGNDDKFGNTLTAAGDVDGDGKDDLLIGGFTATPAADPGAAYVFLGKNLAAALTDAQADTKILGNIANFDLLSLGLSGGVDFNNDGFDDIALGAPQYWTPTNGLTYIFNGSAAGITSCTFTAPATCSPAATITGATKDALGFMGSTFYPLP